VSALILYGNRDIARNEVHYRQVLPGTASERELTVNKNEPLLRIQFDGEAVGAARIPVTHLLRFLGNLTKALQRSGRVLQGEGDSVRRGPQPASIKDEIALDLTELSHGSPSVVLGLDRTRSNPDLPEMDRGLEILEAALTGLSKVQGANDVLPHGYDAGVLKAWRDAGVLFRQGIDRIQFSLNHIDSPLVVEFTPVGLSRIQARIVGAQVTLRTIEGRLLMADFKEHGARCRVHPSVGAPILCIFDDDKKEEVLEEILQYVRVVGEAREDPTTGRINSIRIQDIERLEDHEDEGAEFLPHGGPISPDFWESPTLDELAAMQGVGPVADVETLLGGWPGDKDDGFEEEIQRIRHSGLIGTDA